MEGATSEGQEKSVNGEGETLEAKVVEWEVYEEVWGQMCGRLLVFKNAKLDRAALVEKVEAGILVIYFLVSLNMCFQW